MPGGGGGTVAVALSGVRTTAAGRVMLIGHAGISAAAFTVSDTPGVAYSLSLSMDSTAVLAEGDGHPMALHGFVVSSGATGVFSGSSGAIARYETFVQPGL